MGNDRIIFSSDREKEKKTEHTLEIFFFFSFLITVVPWYGDWFQDHSMDPRIIKPEDAQVPYAKFSICI